MIPATALNIATLTAPTGRAALVARPKSTIVHVTTTFTRHRRAHFTPVCGTRGKRWSPPPTIDMLSHRLCLRCTRWATTRHTPSPAPGPALLSPEEVCMSLLFAENLTEHDAAVLALTRSGNYNAAITFPSGRTIRLAHAAAGRSRFTGVPEKQYVPITFAVRRSRRAIPLPPAMSARRRAISEEAPIVREYLKARKAAKT